MSPLWTNFVRELEKISTSVVCFRKVVLTEHEHDSCQRNKEKFPRVFFFSRK